MPARPGFSLESLPHEIVAESGAVALDTLTVLDNWQGIGKLNQVLEFAFWNDDLAATVVFTVLSASKNGGPPARQQFQITLGPGEHDVITVPNQQMANLIAEFWMTTAQRTDAGTAAVRRKITGVWRGA